MKRLHRIFFVLLLALTGLAIAQEDTQQDVQQDVEDTVGELFDTLSDTLSDSDTLSAQGELSVPDEVSGELTSDDDVRDGSYVDLYTLTVDEPMTVVITMTSDPLDPYLYLEAEDGTQIAENDDGAQGANAQIQRELEAGNYRIIATTLASEVTGPYTLSVQEAETTADETTEVETETAETEELEQTGQLSLVALPSSFNDELTADDGRRGGSYADLYVLRVDEETDITITMASEPLDPYLYLEAEDGTLIAENDDGAGGVDAQIQRTLAPGNYRVIASTLATGATGPYTLRFAESESTSLQPSGELSVPGETDGELTSDDAQRGGSYIDLYTLSVSEETTVVITMTSDPLDPYLYLEAGDGTLIAENDDGAGGFNARISRTLEPGDYRVLASTFASDATGTYTLEVSEGAGLEPSGDLTLPAEVSGELSSDDAIRDNSYADLYTLSIAETTTVVIDMTSDPLDTYLYLEAADGTEITTNDDGGESFNARIRQELEPGDYRIIATTFFSDAIGSYTLSVREAEEVELEPSGELSIPAEVAGELSTDDARRNDSYIDLYLLTVEETTNVTITMTSDPVDPYLYLETEDGMQIAENDDGAQGFNAKISRELEAGTYRILIGTFTPDATGSYTLQVR
ncbi:MAG: hypothetical protein U5L04_09600 [Trueperaceae bacterium]|nr:hypothetical protein [Trueperaceae bacterium]